MIRRAATAERLWGGSRQAFRNWRERKAAWIREGTTKGDKALRMGFVIAGMGLLWLLIRSIPELLWGLAPLWLWRAWKAGGPSPEAVAKKAVKSPHDVTEHEPVHDSSDTYSALLDWVDKSIGHKNGIHLADLLANAHSHNLLNDLDLPAFRTALEGWGIPVRQQLKVGGRNRPGIHRDDLPTAPSPGGTPEGPTRTATNPITSTNTTTPTYVYPDGRPATGGDHDS